jgi:hypothetical protein
MTNWKGRENESFWHTLGVRLVFMAKKLWKAIETLFRALGIQAVV